MTTRRSACGAAADSASTTAAETTIVLYGQVQFK
jgi:hypothetical protein